MIPLPAASFLILWLLDSEMKRFAEASTSRPAG